MRKKIHILGLLIVSSGVFALSACSSDKVTGGGPGGIVVKTPVIVKQLPHSTFSFTQGLLYYDGLLYESNGLNCCSNVRTLDPGTGTVVRNMDLPGSTFFAEGIAIRGAQLFQLTWRAGIAFVYRTPDLLKVGELAYGGEGWGLTADSTGFIMSNGSDTLYYRDDSFQITRKLPVTVGGSPLGELNELEYVNGRIYANVWGNDTIYVIDPAAGQVVAKVDCTALKGIANPTRSEDVLNGIAYNDVTKHFFLTGKRWAYIFEVTIPGE